MTMPVIRGGKETFHTLRLPFYYALPCAMPWRRIMFEEEHEAMLLAW